MEDALKCLELGPQKAAYDYDVGYNTTFGEPITGKPKAVAICDKEEVFARKAELSEYKAKKDEIKRALDEYETQCKAVKEALGGLWEDYYKQRQKLWKYQQVMDTLAEYEKLAGGDKDIALGFLAKAFDSETIEAARAWFA